MSKVLLHELGKSLSYGRLSLLAKVLWPMLLASTDDQGRGTAEPDAIKWYVCPNVPEITLDKVPDLLREMVDLGMIVVYETVRGQAYQIFRWWEYQSLRWARPSKYPPPEGWTDRIRYSNRGQMFQKDWDQAGGFTTELRVELPTEDYTENSTENPTDFQPNPTTTQPNQQPNPTQPNPTTTSPPIALPVDNSDGDGVVVALREELLGWQMLAPQAEQCIKQRTPEDIRAFLDYAEVHRKEMHNPPGFLYDAMVRKPQPAPPPCANSPPATGSKEDRLRYVSGEYGDMVQH